MKKERVSWRYEIELSAAQERRILSYIAEELNFYNELNQRMNQLIRQIPDGFSEAAANLRVFGELIEHNINIKDAIKNTPNSLKVIKDDLIFLSEKAQRVLELATIPTQISIRTKRNLGVEMLRFYGEQASLLTATVGDGYRQPPTLLENLDSLRKRHIQLHRKATIIEFDSQTNQTSIKIPYLQKPIIVEANVKKNHWDILILHQWPNTIPTNNTKWCVDLKKNPREDYLLKYLDLQNPNAHSSFFKDQQKYK